jgi:hypothetical protein
VELDVDDIPFERAALVGRARPVPGFDREPHRRRTCRAGQVFELSDDDVVHGPKDYPTGGRL